MNVKTYTSCLIAIATISLALIIIAISVLIHDEYSTNNNQSNAATKLEQSTNDLTINYMGGIQERYRIVDQFNSGLNHTFILEDITTGNLYQHDEGNGIQYSWSSTFELRDGNSPMTNERYWETKHQCE